MPGRHPNEIAMEQERAAYAQHSAAINAARNIPHPNQVAAAAEQAAPSWPAPVSAAPIMPPQPESEPEATESDESP